jgi:hypothetical protein
MEVKTMKCAFIIATLLLCVVAYSPAASAQAVDQYGYANSDDFMSGYHAGYDHGIQDRRAGVNFDYEHSDAYLDGGPDFQSGYEQGYSEHFTVAIPHEAIPIIQAPLKYSARRVSAEM